MSERGEPGDLSRLQHDLRSPLTAVIGFAELMAGEQPISDEERRDYSERMLDAAFEMRALLDRALPS
jgi:signal transduction histidine kinase